MWSQLWYIYDCDFLLSNFIHMGGNQKVIVIYIVVKSWQFTSDALESPVNNINSLGPTWNIINMDLGCLCLSDQVFSSLCCHLFWWHLFFTIRSLESTRRELAGTTFISCPTCLVRLLYPQISLSKISILLIWLLQKWFLPPYYHLDQFLCLLKMSFPISFQLCYSKLWA